MSAPRLLQLCSHCFTNTITKSSNVTKTLIFGQNSNDKLNILLSNFSAKFNLMALVLSEQCNRVAALRLRRAYQISQFYQRIYGESVPLERLHRIKGNITKFRKGKSLAALLSAAVFDWKAERVTDDDINRFFEESKRIYEFVDQNDNSTPEALKGGWESITDSKDLKIWRKWNPQTELFIYRVLGHFGDITPRAFFKTQVDVLSWGDWDENTLDVKIVDTDEESQSEIIRWFYKFPYPLAPRDYLYVRRYVTDTEKNAFMITARAVEHPECPKKDDSIRVETYTSTMVIKPHTTFDQNGFAYTLMYCDDPKTSFPSFAYKWMASTGVKQFLEKVHEASKKKEMHDPILTRFATPSNMYTVHQV